MSDDTSEFHYVLPCPCGQRIEGDSEDELVERSFVHLRAEHPDLADVYEREHVIFMMLKLRK
jgi:hypothetical protein